MTNCCVIEHVPESLLIVGGGVIGCEFASVFNRLGAHVTVVEMLDQLLPGEDKRTGRTLQQAFKKAGIDVFVKTAVEAAEGAAAGVTLRLAGGTELTAARVLVAVGRRPLSAGLGYEEAGVELDAHGFVVTDETQRTAAPGVFAAGDVAGPPMLAHWAYHQGAVAAENAVTGSRIACDRSMVPNCVFSSPEVASCGLSEDRAAEQGVEVEVAAVRFNGNSKAVVEGDADGFVRIVCAPGGGRVLGASLVGPHVTELVHELALAVHAGLSLADVAATIHAHPTLSEAVGEAALGGVGRGIHSCEARVSEPPAYGVRRLGVAPRPPGRRLAPAGRRKPDWLKVKAPAPRQYRATGALLDELELHTVCAEARCPNKGECFSSGTATFLILGDVCTRACAFCAVEHGRLADAPTRPRRRRRSAVLRPRRGRAAPGRRGRPAPRSATCRRSPA